MLKKILKNMLKTNKTNMATIYKIELVSHWANFSEKELQRLLEQAIKQVKEFTNNGNEITIEVKERN